jgi:hypothetical protein
MEGGDHDSVDRRTSQRLEARISCPLVVPELGGDVVVVLAAQGESTESVLQETLDEIREKAALSKLGRRAAVSWMKENPY